MDIEELAVLNKIRNEIEIFELILEMCEEQFDRPKFNRQYRGFRYDNPGMIEFCTLKAMFAVSNLRAATILAEAGYAQQVGLLLRVVIDAYTQIEFVLAGYKDGVLGRAQSKHIKAFFEDYQRGPDIVPKSSKTRQEDIHEVIAKSFLEGNSVQDSGPHRGKKPTDMLYKIYITFCNYIHGSYPEILDMFGGASPGYFHLSGMKDTPKDHESLAQLSCFCDSVALSVRHMVLIFQLKEKVFENPELAAWWVKSHNDM